MKPELVPSGFNPEAQPNPYSQIPDLVRTSILAKPKDARRAQKELVGIIQQDIYSDPVLIAVSATQKVLLSAKNTDQIRQAKDFLEEIIFHGAGGDNPRQELVFRVNQQVLDAVLEISQNDKTIQEKRYLKRDLPRNYESFVNPLIRMQKGIEKQLQQGAKEISILQFDESLSDDELDKLREVLAMHNKWEGSLREVILESDLINFNTIARDTLVDLLKNEPESNDIRIEKLYTKKYAGVSLEDIEQMSYPVSMEEWIKIANYLVAARLNMESDPKLTDKANAIAVLFFNSTPFGEDITYRNSRILGNINSWQEFLIYHLVFAQNEEVDMQIKNLVQTTERNIKFAPLIVEYSRDPFVSDPGTKKGKVQDVFKHHPLFAQASSYYLDRHEKPDVDSALSPSLAISEEYFREILLPQLKRRVASLGINDRFDGEIRELEQDLVAEGHLRFIKAVFEKNCGQEYLERLQAHSQEIEEVTINAWQDALEKMHFLPMQEGENIIEFSEGIVPNIQGLESISMVRLGSQQDWKILVAFKPLNIPFKVYALLTQDGKLDFQTSLEQEIPGLYTMLNHIAVLTFHDLVIQERKERENRDTTILSQDVEPKTDEPQEAIRLDEGNQDIEDDTQPRTSHPRSLPRVQKDTGLIRDVYQATNRTPRRVELHKRTLQKTADYKIALELYQEALGSGAPQEVIQWTREQIEETRQKTYKISPEKRDSVPAQFRLSTIQDPITEEEIYLETWVVEHSSPKPTPEELQSPVKLYERYYRNSSALASLDQMKPWFVGQ